MNKRFKSVFILTQILVPTTIAPAFGFSVVLKPGLEMILPFLIRTGGRIWISVKQIKSAISIVFLESCRGFIYNPYASPQSFVPFEALHISSHPCFAVYFVESKT